MIHRETYKDKSKTGMNCEIHERYFKRIRSNDTHLYAADRDRHEYCDTFIKYYL